MNVATNLNTPFSVLIRADANPSIGSGHLTRMIALSSACRNSGAHVTFVSNEMPATLQKTINETGCQHQRIDIPTGTPEDADFTANFIQNGNFDWTVLDGYQFDDTYQQRVGQTSSRLMVVDDFGHATHQNANLILNQNAYADRSRYDQLTSTDVICGLKYTLLRPEFHTRSLDYPGRKNARFNVKRILITFGGSDINDWTSATLRTLLELKLATTSRTVADVVVGANYTKEKELAQFCRDAGMNVFLHRNVDRMDALMNQADLAITAGGSTCYELARTGVPAIAIATADNQKPVVSALEQRGTLLGFFADENPLSSTSALSDDIKTAIRKLVRNREQRQSMTEQGKRLLDGLGAERVTRKLHAGVISFRDASLQDSQMLFALRNDPVVREASFNQSPVTQGEHERWLNQTLASPNRLLWIPTDRSLQPLGRVQMDLSDNLKVATISVALDNRSRGRGLGPVVIEKATEMILSDSGAYASVGKVIANIKPANSRSCMAFEKVGFEFSTPTTVNEEIALRYVCLPDAAVSVERPATIRKSA
jgi:UDP-2,4-diacetamido-2,4,6-trideoxy-beta-L-altropyranose hydrolase